MQRDPDSFSGDRPPGPSRYDPAMVNQDRAKQERLLNLAGWLYHKHRFQTRDHGKAYTEVRFTREDLGDVPALAAYGLDRGDAGEQAIYRDTGALEEFGVEVRWDPSRQTWVSRVFPLTDAECRALATAALQVLVEDGSSRADGYHVPGAGLSAEGAELIVAYAPMVDTLIEAVRTRSSVAVVHRGVERTVDPWHVFLTDGRWYVIGHDHDVGARRAFALDAIEFVRTETDEGSYQIPPEDFTSLGLAMIDPDRWVSSDPVEVTLEVDRRLSSRAEELLGAVPEPTIRSGDWVSMTCTVRNVDAFMSRLWGLRARAIVTGPQEIRSRVIDELREMC